MNVRGLIFMGLLLIASIGLVQAQTYERQWKKVEELEKKDLPKSVVEAAQTIYVKAEKEKNVPQMMKAFLTMMAYRNEISPDSLQVDLQKMEAWASSSQTSVPDKAVLYSIMGEIILLKGMDACAIPYRCGWYEFGYCLFMTIVLFFICLSLIKYLYRFPILSLLLFGKR